MRFEVPQFIEIEDKIFGPLTWRQFLYLGGGIGMAVILFITTNLIVFIMLGIPIALLSSALSFYPVNNRPFSFFLEALFNYLTKQKLYLWRHNENIVHRGATSVRNTPTITGVTPSTRKNIASLARRLELQAIQKTE